jgi:hypothetical protein
VTKEERKAYHTAWRAANRGKVKAQHAAQHVKYYATLEGRAYHMWNSAKQRAKRSGVPFEISREYVLALAREYGTVCPALGTPFQTGLGRALPESMSLDRFDAALGYVEGNCWVLSNKANMIKSSATRTELGRVYRWMCKVIGEQADD